MFLAGHWGHTACPVRLLEVPGGQGIGFAFVPLQKALAVHRVWVGTDDPAGQK